MFADGKQSNRLKNRGTVPAVSLSALYQRSRTTDREFWRESYLMGSRHAGRECETFFTAQIRADGLPYSKTFSTCES
jgi:hypothetical protein